MISGALDKRLLSCADCVRAGAVLADVGTDHGYLPIFLLKSGRISRAVLSDVNEGPLSKAIDNVKESGLSQLCEFVLTNGAADLDGKGVTDYAICGMGGKLIASIIDAAPQLKAAGVRLILQPMSKHSTLRKYLAANGFLTVGERYSFCDGKYYLTVCAEYSGSPYEITDIDAEIGACTPSPSDRVEYIGYLEGKLKACEKTIRGKRLGGLPTDKDEAYRDALIERIRENSI